MSDCASGDWRRLLRRHPTAADAALAAALCRRGARLASTRPSSCCGRTPRSRSRRRPAIVLAVLAVTLPLALRRRFPLAVACVVIVAFVVGRLALAPGVAGLAAWEGTMTVWACWIALYSAVVHGADRRTALVVAVLAAVLLGEVVREVFFYGGAYRRAAPQRGRSARLQRGRPSPFRCCSASRSGRGGIASASWPRGRRELQREREENARQRGARGAGADRARAARRRRPPRQRDGRAGRRGAARDGAAARQGRGGPELDRGLQPAGRPRAAPPARRSCAAPTSPTSWRPSRISPSSPTSSPRRGKGGLTVELSIEGEPRPLPRTLEVSAYRVIQEALTNARQALRRDDRHRAGRLPDRRCSRSRCSTTARSGTGGRRATSAATG